MKPRIVFFGTADFSLASLRELLKAGFNVVAVVTQPDKPSGRSKQPEASAVKQFAQEKGIPVLQPSQLNEDFIKELTDLKPDAGVVVSYGRIVPKPVLNLFKDGLINVHASLLPKYRGSSPIESAILNGDEKTGVTLMQLDEGMDTGPIYISEETPLRTETRPELYEKLAEIGANLLVKSLPDIISGKLKPTPQEESSATEVKMLQKSDGSIDWTQPAEQIERQVRAYLGWPGSRTRIHGKDATITATHVLVGQESTDGIPMETGDGVLVIERLIPAGKKEMTAGEFMRGIR